MNSPPSCGPKEEKLEDVWFELLEQPDEELEIPKMEEAQTEHNLTTFEHETTLDDDQALDDPYYASASSSDPGAEQNLSELHLLAMEMQRRDQVAEMAASHGMSKRKMSEALGFRKRPRGGRPLWKKLLVRCIALHGIGSIQCFVLFVWWRSALFCFVLLAAFRLVLVGLFGGIPPCKCSLVGFGLSVWRHSALLRFVLLAAFRLVLVGLFGGIPHCKCSLVCFGLSVWRHSALLCFVLLAAFRLVLVCQTPRHVPLSCVHAAASVAPRALNATVHRPCARQCVTARDKTMYIT